MLYPTNLTKKRETGDIKEAVHLGNQLDSIFHVLYELTKIKEDFFLLSYY